MHAETAKDLDDPVGAALTTGHRIPDTGHRALAEGGALARRSPAEVSPFGALADRTPAAFVELAALTPSNGRIALATVDRPAPQAGSAIEMQAPVMQLVMRAPASLVSATLAHVVEISAVCVDPAHRGKGDAGVLMTRLAERHHADGLSPILHVFAENAPAIAVCKMLGYVRRRTLHMTALRTST